MNEGQILRHRYLKGLTVELVAPTAKGWKVKETQVFFNSRKRPHVKTAYYTKLDFQQLFELA